MTVTVNVSFGQIATDIGTIATKMGTINTALIGWNFNSSFTSWSADFDSLDASLQLLATRLNTLNGYMTFSAAGLAAWVADLDTKFLVWSEANGTAMTALNANVTASTAQLALIKTEQVNMVTKLTAMIAELVVLEDRVALTGHSAGTDVLPTLPALITALNVLLALTNTALAGTNTALGVLDATAVTGVAALGTLDATAVTGVAALGTLDATLSAAGLAIDGVASATATAGTNIGTMDTTLSGIHDRIAPLGTSIEERVSAAVTELTALAGISTNIGSVGTAAGDVAAQLVQGAKSVFDLTNDQSILFPLAGIKDSADIAAFREDHVEMYGPGGIVVALDTYGPGYTQSP